ncbi:TIR domain-containing protein [Zoogloea sp.]|uniref:TIR domain-containing protein n=1 Tax=Zoogloea sp. TaxID=49181 RepID=UPI00260EE241|nr:TIR domain-containing protein [Zoogloea sp.]
MARKIFYSFHFDNDVMRVQQVRNMGVVEGNTPVSPNNWEEVKKKGNAAVEKWIDDNMFGKSCVIVLIGTDTHKRPWVNYEIKKAWKDGKGLLGIHIHNLTCPNNGKSSKGTNPFDAINFTLDGKAVVPKVYDPKSSDAYNDIATNLSGWVEAAIKQRNG